MKKKKKIEMYISFVEDLSMDQLISFKICFLFIYLIFNRIKIETLGNLYTVTKF